MKKFKDDFVGTGSLKVFCEEADNLFSALNNIYVKVPKGYDGIAPILIVEDVRMVFDFGDALIFTLNNVSWNLTGTAAFTSSNAEVVDGQLLISVNAESIV